MIIQRTLAALAAVGIFSASAGCMYAYADELDNIEQLPGTIYATAGDDSSADGAVIYSMDSSNYTDGYKVDLKAEKDNLLSVDKITVSGEMSDNSSDTDSIFFDVFGVGEQRSDGYYLTLDYTDDLGQTGQIEVGPFARPLYSVNNISDTLEISSDTAEITRNVAELDLKIDDMNNHDDYPGWVFYGNDFPDLFTMLGNLDTSVSRVIPYVSSCSIGLRFNCLRPDLRRVFYFNRASDLFPLSQSDVKTQYAGYVYRLFYADENHAIEKAPVAGVLPSNVQSLQISCSGNVSAEVSNRPSVVPSVTSEDGLPAVFSVAGKYADFATSNPITAVCFSSMFVPIAIAIFKACKGV